MRNLILAAFLFLTFPLLANFHDSHTGLSIQIPETLKRTWNLSHFEKGMEFTLYNSDEEDQLKVVLIGKIPLSELPEGFENDYPILLGEFGESVVDLFNEDGPPALTFAIDQVITNIKGFPVEKRHRIACTIPDVEEPIYVDFVSFIKNGYFTFVIVGCHPCIDGKTMDDFTNPIFGSLRFKLAEKEMF